MVQFVGNDGIFSPQQRFEESPVGIEARAVKNCVFGSEKCAQRGLRFFLDTLRSADEPHRRKAITPAVEGRVRPAAHSRIPPTPQVCLPTTLNTPPPLPPALRP